MALAKALTARRFYYQAAVNQQKLRPYHRTTERTFSHATLFKGFAHLGSGASCNRTSEFALYHFIYRYIASHGEAAMARTMGSESALRRPRQPSLWAVLLQPRSNSAVDGICPIQLQLHPPFK